MKRETLYQPFEIVYKQVDECPKQEHKHLFFELVYILSGTGTQCINDNRFHYHPGHLFLLTPEDCHSFDVATTTEFFFLRFNDSYVQSGAFTSETRRQLEYILQNASHQPGCVLRNLSDKPFVKALVQAVIAEHNGNDVYHRELLHQFVNTLIVIVARNIAKYLPAGVRDDTDEKARAILHYIQANIQSPEKLKAGIISREFGVSSSYLGRYFKHHLDETMQQYITGLRVQLIETRLRFSNLRISEIANELGFADESHFNKFFRKATGKSASQFRKELRGLKEAV